MAKVEDCPGFETFGADVKAARKAKHLTRKVLAEIVGIEWRYLANIENKGTIPSLPVVIQLIKVCGLPVEQYFNPEIIRGDSEQRQRVSHKLKLCPEHYLPVIEGAIDGALKIEQSANPPYFKGFINARHYLYSSGVDLSPKILSINTTHKKRNDKIND